jgi:hypothetical protein
MRSLRDDQSLSSGLIGDGRPLIGVTALALLLSGAFAIFLAVRREFLPHDVAFLGMEAAALCELAGCRVVGFMFHDRVAFGGALIAVAVLYLWIVAFPLREGLRWAWHTLAVSGTLGFASFLAYLGYGYLDGWHGAGTLALLPVFVVGLWHARAHAVRPVDPWLRSAEGLAAAPAARLGRWGLVATGAGMLLAGLVILMVGATSVFVPQDLAFMGLTREELAAVSPRLIPLIAHDRAGFGGGLASAGTLVAMCAWYARPGRAFFEAVIAAGLAGFGCALGVHYVEGYTDVVHLAPAIAGAALFAGSVALEAAGIGVRAPIGPAVDTPPVA